MSNRKIKRKKRERVVANEVRISDAKKASLIEFMSGKNVATVFNSDEEMWTGFKINESFTLEVEPNTIKLIHNDSDSILKKFSSIESVLEDDAIFKAIDEMITQGVVSINEYKEVLVMGNEIDNDYIGVWTDGHKAVIIDTEEELIMFNEYGLDGELVSEELYEIAELNNYINNNGIEELDYTYEDDYRIYKAIAKGLEADGEKLAELYTRRTKKSDSVKLMKDTARLMLDEMKVAVKYFDINQLLSEVYSYNGYVVGGFVAETGCCVYVLRPGKPTKLSRVECGDVTMDTILDGNLITHFFNTIEVELDKI